MIISNKELELIQSYQNNSNDMIEKQLLSNILNDIKFRIPVERHHTNGTCPNCETHIDSKSLFCKHCGQAIE